MLYVLSKLKDFFILSQIFNLLLVIQDYIILIKIIHNYQVIFCEINKIKILIFL